jgi:hypothetical protein
MGEGGFQQPALLPMSAGAQQQVVAVPAAWRPAAGTMNHLLQLRCLWCCSWLAVHVRNGRTHAVELSVLLLPLFVAPVGPDAAAAAAFCCCLPRWTCPPQS